MARTHYIDNKIFLENMTAYKKAVNEHKELGKPKPRIPEYVGSCFMKIAEKLSHKPNFLSYSFRDEMIADAIENCVMYVDNFDPNVSSNPFAYFTQIVYYAFLRRIQREKKQLYVKYKSAEMIGSLDEGNLLEDENGNVRPFEVYSNISEFIDNFEKAQIEKKAKLKINLEKFIEDD